ncbi:MAG TPA: proprotein convertase P-domain-containing protein [Ignavibacteria bacterium]|nr:proprotein convertase P-domain-containing protein [Ignavibacteria bacterium]
MKTIIILLIIISAVITSECRSQIYWSAAGTFAGSNTSYVSVPNSSTINLSGSFSIEAWINPSTFAGASKGIISKGGALGTSLIYAIRLNSTGRISVMTNGSPRLTSRVTSPVTLNNWTHISATYNSSSGLFSIYINGLQDTSASVAGAAPNSNADSLFIGISGSSTPYTGKIDEVRLWNRALSASEVSQFMRTSLGTSSGIYSGLIMSIAFQGENTSADRLKDMSGNNNNAVSRNILLSSPLGNMAGSTFFKPLETISQNECLELDGIEDYLAGKDTTALNSDSAVTLECWVYPRTNSSCRLITKGNNYALIYSGNNLNAMINNTVFTSDKTIPLNQWTYLAFTYRSNGVYNFYVNGVNVKSSSVVPANINITTDSLYVGGGQGSIGDLNGYLDEARITNKAKTQEEIFRLMYASLDKLNDPNLIQSNINYSFDGNTLDNVGDGGPRLYFRNNARFTHPAQITAQPVSPLNQDNNFLFSRAFYIRSTNIRIPVSGTAGTVSDSMNINFNGAVTDVNLFISINHTKSSDLDIILIAPNGDSVTVFANMSANSLDNNIITTFDDNADSTIINGRYASFYAKIKPENSMNSKFAGDNAKGFWKLKIRDEVSSNSGFFYGWGIQINDFEQRPKNLNLSALIQGFYDSTSNTMTPDTISARIIGTSIDVTDKAVIGTDGKCYFSYFPNGSLTNEKPFLLQITHRNSIETWLDQSLFFTFSEANIDFMNLNDEVLGENVIKADNFPVRFAIFGGDVNQDDAVDLTDVITVFNSASNFVTGYNLSDVTGNNLVDLTDIVLVFNNSNNFVHSEVP